MTNLSEIQTGESAFYISTMANCLEVAGKEGVEFIVLDRINPINGRDVEGPVQIEKSTFVGIHPIAIRHGMTIGEIALMLNAECDYHAKVTVVKMKGWMLRHKITDLSPQSVMQRGYGIIAGEDGKTVTGARDAHKGERIRIIMADGDIRALVEEVSDGR